MNKYNVLNDVFKSNKIKINKISDKSIDLILDILKETEQYHYEAYNELQYNETKIAYKEFKYFFKNE